MDTKRKEKLPPCQIPQLEACAKRGPNHVRHVENGENGTIYVRSRDPGTLGRLSMPRSRP